MDNFEDNSLNKYSTLLSQSGFDVKSLPVTANNIEIIQINPAQITKITEFLKSNLQTSFDMLFSINGTDYGESLGVIYHFYSTETKDNLIIKAILDKTKPNIDSLSHIYNAANWHEREAFDLLGINFNNHPNLKRILLPDSWQGHPLRKDYEMNDQRLSWNER